MILEVIIVLMLLINIGLLGASLYILLVKKEKKIINTHIVELNRKEISSDQMIQLCNNPDLLSIIQDIIHNMRINAIDNMQFADRVTWDGYNNKISGWYELEKQIEWHAKTGSNFKNNK